MKKLYSIVILMIISAGIMNAQCTIDSSHLATPGVYPASDSLPCIIQNVHYDQTIQGRIQARKDTTISTVSAVVTVDSLRLDTIQGLPSNITWTKYPNVLPGGKTGCITFSGTTTDTTGNYTLTGIGTVWLTINAPPVVSNYKYSRHGNLNQFSSFGNYHLTVVASFADCTHTDLTGIGNVNNDLASTMSVYPNPTSGVFEFKLDGSNRVNGEIVIVDVTGRTVYSQKLDVAGMYSTAIDLSRFAKGLYTLQLRTAEGFASKNISVE